MNAMYSVEQIRTPPELGTVMKQYTKAVLRDRPQNVYKYSANFFALLCGQTEPFDEDGQLVADGGSVQDTVTHRAAVQNSVNVAASAVDKLFAKYDVTHSGFMECADLPVLLADLAQLMDMAEAGELPTADEVMANLGGDTARVDLLELRHLLRLTE